MKNKFIIWLKIQSKERFFRICTIIGLIVLYLIIFHNDIYQQFVRFIILTALQQLITNIVTDKSFVTALGMGIVGLCVWIKR